MKSLIYVKDNAREFLELATGIKDIPMRRIQEAEDGLLICSDNLAKEGDPYPTIFVGMEWYFTKDGYLQHFALKRHAFRPSDEDKEYVEGGVADLEMRSMGAIMNLLVKGGVMPSSKVFIG
jgi:hypothetical protein